MNRVMSTMMYDADFSSNITLHMTNTQLYIMVILHWKQRHMI